MRTFPSHTEQEEDLLPVEEDAADVVVVYGRLLGAGGHAQRPKEAVDQNGELVNVLRLCFHHVEHDLVPLPHALCVRRADVILDDDLPLPPAQPATHETLHLQWSHSNPIMGSHALCPLSPL